MKEERINALIIIFGSTGVPAIVIGVGLTIFLGLADKDQAIGITVALLGVIICMMIFPLLILKLLFCKPDDVVGEETE